MRSEQVVGILLVALGGLLLLVFQTQVGGEAVPLFIGAGFLVAYATARSYGLLVPAGILTGLGAGIVVAAAGGPDSAPVLGLGLGFLAIYAVDLAVSGNRAVSWWPLIPGGILTFVGVSALPVVRDIFQYLIPLAFVLAGLALLLLGRRRSAARDDTGGHEREAAADAGNPPEPGPDERTSEGDGP